mmetsp:Transcript_20649/g.32904  ORF Transcript_20649/g.32904 Transcript_20649/m.32904 type:complete len:92 (+) Transcript_20649:23-298(+)
MTTVSTIHKHTQITSLRDTTQINTEKSSNHVQNYNQIIACHFFVHFRICPKSFALSGARTFGKLELCVLLLFPRSGNNNSSSLLSSELLIS